MKTIITLCMTICMLSGCNRLEERTRDIRYKVDNEYDKMRYKLSGYLYERDGTPPDAQAPLPYYPAKYCYQLPSDVVCYRTPQHRIKGQFIGMQGEDGAYYADTPVYDERDEVDVHEGWGRKSGTTSKEALERQAREVQHSSTPIPAHAHPHPAGFSHPPRSSQSINSASAPVSEITEGPIDLMPSF